MAWSFVDGRIGAQPIAETSSTKNHPLGTIVRAVDPTYGEGEFIYLLGVANTAVGHGVVYDASGYQTALASVVGGTARPLAIAMSANVANQYGWYQISGKAVVKKASATSFAAAAPLGITSGLAVAASTAKRLSNAVVSAAASGASAVVSAVVAINRPTNSTVAET